ncbi:HNH endonuclease [Yersinia rochesterensis]|uniref:HNH endonuclease n=1 Tax=Yersinia TaxID=629 RepID=UPI00224031F8|nr:MULTISPECIES: HNH endonuclease [Yersinia]MDA5543834.1 HNH endonuclease [Yersinia rochesterensis]UZM74461.1 HNH endonuclease [Yersinia sp. SCPM-O-B-9106 (C-191)]
MKKIPIHKKSFTEMLEKCSEGMEQRNVRRNFNSLFTTFLQKEQQYQELSSVGNLFLYPKLDPLTGSTRVIGNLTKTKLINLYENNLRNKDKPARGYYDDLLVSSGERCPFCGDIGQTKNLDHFLPKAHFPEFSVMPLNLVPSCRDCNMGEKGQNYAIAENNQAIHPFIDKDIFFQVQWVFADYIHEDDGAISYYVNCPTNWRQEDKDRAFNHFNNLNLASRYRLEAGKHLSEVIDQKNAFERMLRRLVPTANLEMIKSGFIESNLQPMIDSDQFDNHWKKVMYQCLANSDEFF